eukprot:1141164-Pelagomonas_calceolata.AAC.3
MKPCTYEQGLQGLQGVGLPPENLADQHDGITVLPLEGRNPMLSLQPNRELVLPRPELREALWRNGHTLVGKECHQAFGGSPEMFNESPGILVIWRRYCLERCVGVILWKGKEESAQAKGRVH